ncbi:hypothetical protein AB0B66_07515 [Catellatospora sp. NPDC049111]|uniref:hypothetical protein n=1 Tax=Catellatospora sp. NPDC049111 TaxID=3155271 RepID=UPI0033C9DF53
MTDSPNWRDVKAKARTIDPAWDTDERTARRARMREEMLAPGSGTKPAEIHQQLGLTQS